MIVELFVLLMVNDDVADGDCRSIVLDHARPKVRDDRAFSRIERVFQ